MKNAEVKALSTEELRERIAAEKENLQKLNFAHAISPIENPMKIRDSRKLIARLNTELRAKELNS
ncbi:50S ribosomal protein L29 [Nafulsella turpanensis]|uniref:50S ribosomal protein L29 n=1 Tax=Nafulsella turpanensis TaxID=1265690 RepID=UPI00034BDA8A|nr:50S ribosomal protein L29 [Nafulsella turpanensis]